MFCRHVSVHTVISSGFCTRHTCHQLCSWVFLAARDLQCLQSVLNAAVQFIKPLSRHAIANVSSLAAHQTVRVHYMLFVWRLAPSYLAELIVPTTIAGLHKYWGDMSEVCTVAVRRCGTYLTLGNRAFSVTAPRAWNNFLPCIRHISSMDVSSKNLKSFLFACGF